MGQGQVICPIIDRLHQLNFIITRIRKYHGFFVVHLVLRI
ncbi:MAG: hypothetical protein H6Q69_751 [Firmicutes bacterium]|nr:hypothetical protein [Bacillota bacterium]